MDIIRFEYTPGMVQPVVLDKATIVPNIKSIMWVERYRNAGEFTFTTAPDSGVKELLTPGTMVSHLNTREVMIVENVGFTESIDGYSDIAISGRSFETILEQRVVGQNYSWPKAIPSLPADMLPRKIILPADYVGYQVVELIRYYTMTGYAVNVNDIIDGLFPVCSIAFGDIELPFDLVDREIDRGVLYDRVLELLSVDDLGIKTNRPVTGFDYLGLIVHKGTDRSGSVNFDYNAGEIRDGDYLLSNKMLKNSALVLGKYLEVFIPGTSTGYDRRVMVVDASDIDEGYSAYPTVPAEHAALVDKMTIRGNMLLNSQNELNITRVEVTENANSAAYRTDYDLGDKVTVSGNYSTSSKLRVIEYVEIQDENGERGYPTLSGL